MRLTLVALGLLSSLVMAGCGSSSSTTASPPSETGTLLLLAPSANASPQARMVCRSEAQQEIAAALGVSTIGPVQTTWIAPDLTCTYRYANGVLRLQVRDEPSLAATKTYFDQLASSLGRKASLEVRANQAVSVTNGSVLARKDSHVLDVDVTGLPASFGKPAMPRDQVAYSVAGIIMACWAGDKSS